MEITRKKKIAKEFLILFSIALISLIVYLIGFLSESNAVENLNTREFAIEQNKAKIKSIINTKNYRKHEYLNLISKDLKNKDLELKNAIEILYKDVKGLELNNEKFKADSIQIEIEKAKIVKSESEIIDINNSFWMRNSSGEISLEFAIILLIIAYPVRLILYALIWSIKTVKQ
jgi:uncharacterized protein (UPF0333 family)